MTDMNCLDYTAAAPAELLALDHALLEEAEAGRGEATLLFWESSIPFVVLGYTEKAAREAHLDACRKLNIPVMRRCSGGGTVLQGPGCLNYSLLLPIEQAGPFSDLGNTNRAVMERQRRALQTLTGGKVEVRGITDLALDGRKFSGNAQRRKKRFLLFHGTFLLNFDLPLISRVLQSPSRQPDYRAGRNHDEFITNFPATSEAVKAALRDEWDAHEQLTTLRNDRVAELVADFYSQDSWNFRF